MPWQSSSLKAHLVRLKPGQDLIFELKSWAKSKNIQAASILSAVGSLKKITLRYANQPEPETRNGHFEVVSLSGTLNADSMHLHASASLPSGETIGGHLMGENLVYTTMELAIAEYPEVSFFREHDPASGYSELAIRTADTRIPVKKQNRKAPK